VRRTARGRNLLEARREDAEAFLADVLRQRRPDAGAGRDFVSRRDTAIIMLLLDTGARRSKLARWRAS
jgi:integrase